MIRPGQKQKYRPISNTLLERGYVGVEWLDDDGNVLPEAATDGATICAEVQ